MDDPAETARRAAAERAMAEERVRVSVMVNMMGALAEASQRLKYQHFVLSGSVSAVALSAAWRAAA